MRRLVWHVVALISAAPVSGWNRRSVSDFVRTRTGAGGRDARLIWRGRGTLSNTLTGSVLADVETVERCERCGATEYASERVVVYRTPDANGTLLAPPLRYAHNVSLSLLAPGAAGGAPLLLRAVDAADGRTVASGWGFRRGPSRVGLRSSFDLAVRPRTGDAAADEPPPAAAARSSSRRGAGGGLPRVAGGDATGGVTREEYQLLGPARPGGRRSLSYKRIGRCPSWCGVGVCTLELRCESCEAPSAPWRQRWRVGGGSAAGRDAPEGEHDHDVMVDHHRWWQRLPLRRARAPPSTERSPSPQMGQPRQQSESEREWRRRVRELARQRRDER